MERLEMENQVVKKEKAPNRPTYKIFVDVVKALERNFNRFKLERVTLLEAAKIISQELGMEISISTVKAARDDFDLQWIEKGRNSNRRNTKGKWNTLINAVVNLYKLFDTPLTEDLANLVQVSKGKN